VLFGHIGVGLAARPTASKVSLWVLLVSVELLDILSSIFSLIGIENIEIGTTWVPWSHGFFISVVWSAAAMGIVGLFYRDRRTGIVIGLLVFSHWVLDFISWAAPLPLLFDNAYLVVGLGLGNSVVIEVIVEVGALVGGLAIHIISAKKHNMVVEDSQLLQDQVRKNITYMVISWSVAIGSVIALGIWSASTALTTISLLGLLYGILCGTEAIGRYWGAKNALQKLGP